MEDVEKMDNEKSVEDNVLEEFTQDDSSLRDMLTEILLNTQEQCTTIDALIRNQINVKDEQINKLYSELQFYKEDYSTKYINQVMKSIIKVRNDMIKRITSSRWECLPAEEVCKEYSYVLDDLTDLLQQQNIDSYETEKGDFFDASRHQVHKVVPTEDSSLDKRIVESVSAGYIKGDKILIFERVIVYQYKQEVN